MVYAIRFFNKFPTFSRLCMRFVATIVKQTKIYTQKQRKCIKQPTVNEKKLLEICWCPQLFCRERVRKFVDSTFERPNRIHSNESTKTDSATTKIKNLKTLKSDIHNRNLRCDDGLECNW